jgi:hypothetical protein
MREAELIELLIKKRQELEENRAANVSSSLLKVQEEEIEELESIYVSGDKERLEKRIFFNQCAEKFDIPTEQGYSR